MSLEKEQEGDQSQPRVCFTAMTLAVSVKKIGTLTAVRLGYKDAAGCDAPFERQRVHRAHGTGGTTGRRALEGAPDFDGNDPCLLSLVGAGFQVSELYALFLAEWTLRGRKESQWGSATVRGVL